MHQIFRKIIGLSLLFLSFYFALSALQWHKKYEDGKGEYEELAQENTEKPKTEADNGTKMDPYMKIDWGKLKGQNSDLVGWIVMDPNVNYPVVQGEDNAYYLHRGFNRGYNINGCIFMSSNNSPDWTDPNTIVYGHNMRNGSMFGTNSKYMSKKYIKKHPYFYIYTEDGRYIYEIFNTMTVQDASDAYEYFFETEDDFSDYLEKIQKNSSVILKEKWSDVKDHIVTLSTCTAHGQLRFLIQGKLSRYEKNPYMQKAGS